MGKNVSRAKRKRASSHKHHHMGSERKKLMSGFKQGAVTGLVIFGVIIAAVTWMWYNAQ